MPFEVKAAAISWSTSVDLCSCLLWLCTSSQYTNPHLLRVYCLWQRILVVVHKKFVQIGMASGKKKRRVTHMRILCCRAAQLVSPQGPHQWGLHQVSLGLHTRWTFPPAASHTYTSTPPNPAWGSPPPLLPHAGMISPLPRLCSQDSPSASCFAPHRPSPGARARSSSQRREGQPRDSRCGCAWRAW